MRHFIVNTTAGSGKAAKMIPIIEHYMQTRNLDYTIWKTAKPMDAKYLAQKACAEKSEAVICVGGDGTIHETAAGMPYSGVPLGIIPSGSGNDFAQSISIKEKVPPFRLLEAIVRGHTKSIDMIRMGQFTFLNIGSIGVDAEIVGHAQKLKPRFKRSSYLMSTVHNVFTFDSFPMRLVADGKEYEGKYTLAAICNGKYYGGGFKIAPEAEIDDGYMTLCVIRELPRAALVTFFPSVFFGIHGKINGVEFIKCRNVSIHYEGMRDINLDGNLYTLKGPIGFEIIPWAVKIITV